MDQSSPDLFVRTREELHSINQFSDFGCLEPFRRYSRSKSEVVQNGPKFCMFLAPKIFGGRAPEFWKLDYKIGPVSNHVAKFHGDRPWDLGDYELETKKHHELSPPVTPYGRPNNG